MTAAHHALVVVTVLAVAASVAGCMVSRNRWLRMLPVAEAGFALALRTAAPLIPAHVPATWQEGALAMTAVSFTVAAVLLARLAWTTRETR